MSSRANAAERETAVSVTKLLAVQGRDPVIRARLLANARAAVGLGRGALPSPDLRGVALIVGAQEGGEAFFDALLDRARKSNDLQFQSEALAALAFAPGERARKAYIAAILAEPFTGSQLRRAFLAMRGSPDTSDISLIALRDAFDTVVARLPGGLAGQGAPELANALCSEAERKALTDIFAANAGKVAGYERSLAQATERIGRCAALRSAKAGELTRALTVSH